MSKKKSQGVFHYHEATKHHFHRMARSSDDMDRENEPNPFRFYGTDKTVPLPLLKEKHKASHMDLFRRKKRPIRPFTVDSIAGFLELSLALSAWKEFSGSRWALRINPSSGNLHPTESHLILPAMASWEGGVYHYDPFHHALEQRAILHEAVWERIRNHFKTDCFLIALSTIFWRESWKYGERAFRYCNHDIGHALAALSFAGNLQGWKVKAFNALSDDDIEALLGFDRTAWGASEKEHPGLLCIVCGNQVEEIPDDLPGDAGSLFSRVDFTGTPNILSKKHKDWSIVYTTADLTRKQRTAGTLSSPPPAPFHCTAPSSQSARDIIRQRRSGAAYDRKGTMPGMQFMSILDKTIPRPGCAPFDADIIRPSTHLLLFVHRVEDLDRGLYFLLRNREDLDDIKKLSDSGFLWEPMDKKLPLFLLQRGDFRSDATQVSCGQDIAGSGCFSLGMISRFRETIEASPCLYRRLFWETGLIGQVLYLEAEAYGFRGTGIGCFFDDEVHRILGFRDNAFQSLYHFAVGKPIEDQRLATFPPYFHLKEV